jgi:chromosome segregation ATPase
LDKRCTILEAEFSNVREQVTAIDGKVDRIDKTLAKQNGALPRLEKSMTALLTQTQQAQSAANEAKTAEASGAAVRKIIWPIVTGLVMILAGILIGKFI